MHLEKIMQSGRERHPQGDSLLDSLRRCGGAQNKVRTSDQSFNYIGQAVIKSLLQSHSWGRGSGPNRWKGTLHIGHCTLAFTEEFWMLDKDV